MLLDLSAFKPEANDEGDAAQIANAYATLEAWSRAIELSGLAQNGATVGQALVWDGTKWAPASVAAASGAQLDYAELTTSTAAITAASEGAAVPVVPGNSVTYDGTKVKLEFGAPHLTVGTNGVISFVFFRDSAALGQFNVHIPSDKPQSAVYYVAYDTPSPGAHTYKVSAFIPGGSFVVNAGAGGPGALLPAYLRVTKA